MSASRLGSRTRGAEVRDATLLGTDIVGSVIAAPCCFTPIVVILLGALGLSGWLDYVVLPALAAFLGLTLYALWRRRRAA